MASLSAYAAAAPSRRCILCSRCQSVGVLHVVEARLRSRVHAHELRVEIVQDAAPLGLCPHGGEGQAAARARVECPGPLLCVQLHQHVGPCSLAVSNTRGASDDVCQGDSPARTHAQHGGLQSLLARLLRGGGLGGRCSVGLRSGHGSGFPTHIQGISLEVEH
eukprot:875745-Rhodomonas_salina.3